MKNLLTNKGNLMLHFRFHYLLEKKPSFFFSLYFFVSMNSKNNPPLSEKDYEKYIQTKRKKNLLESIF